MENFTPVSALAGGALIGLATALMLVFNGRIAGISGIVGGLLTPKTGDIDWRLFFVGGMLGGGALLMVVAPQLMANNLERSYAAVAVAGLLVGYGTRLGNGCTSGHGVCGLPRMSPRSLVATLTFMATGAIAATVVTQLLGGSL